MGCDIHSIGQIKLGSNNWKTVKVSPGGDDRNYDSFAVMADVRNGFGFAGVKTGEGWEPISKPRGLPDDILKLIDYDFHLKVASYVPKWSPNSEPRTEAWLGDHSHSWLLLSEMENAMKGLSEQFYETFGVITKESFLKLKEGEQPESWCGGVRGLDVKVFPAKMVPSMKGDYTHVEASWKTPATEKLWQLKKIIEALTKIKEENNLTSDEVRLVFGFDS